MICKEVDAAAKAVRLLGVSLSALQIGGDEPPQMALSL
jgi:hypothetical protein